MIPKDYYLIDILIGKASTASTAQEAQEYAQAAYLASQAVLNVSKAMRGDN
jgi:hypothetical protein